MAEAQRFDDGQGTQLTWTDWPSVIVGSIWPWVFAAFGVLVVAVGAVAFSPALFG